MGTNQYYAVAAKVRAMYGMRIKREDYTHIASMQSVSEMSAFLRTQPSYAMAVGSSRTDTVNRLELEHTIQSDLLNEYFRILNFVGQSDVVIMRYLVVSMELREIMRFMRLSKAGRAHDYTFTMPKYFDRYSKIYYAQLSVAVTYAGMLEALRDTQYHQVLGQLPLDASGWPNYTSVELAVRSSYYRWVMSVVNKNYSGAQRSSLKESIGFEVDMLNIATIFRVRRNFPKLVDNITSFLLPISYKLKPAVIKQLLAAPGEEAMLAILQASGFARFFTGQIYDEVDRYYYTGMIAFHRRQIREGTPYVGTPMAYLFLKELEIRNLITLTECIQYHVPTEKALSYLYVL